MSKTNSDPSKDAEIPTPAHSEKDAAVKDLRLRLAERQLDRLALCPDHRDKATGRCIVCQAEERTRQELRSERAAAAPDLRALHEALKAADAVMTMYVYPKPDVGPEHPWSVLQRVREQAKVVQAALDRLNHRI